MKQVLTLLLIKFSVHLTLGQVAFHDAIELNKISTSNDGTRLIFPLTSDAHKDAASILGKYVNNSNDYTVIQKAFADNPFITLPKIDAASIGGPIGVGLLNNGVNSIGISGSAIGIGFADFLIANGKKELNEFFFIRFKTRIEKSEILQSLFPSTYKKLLLAGQDIYKFKQYLKTLQKAFKDDIEKLFVNLAKINPESDLFKDAIKGTKEQGEILISIFTIVSQVLENDNTTTPAHPGDILGLINQRVNDGSNYSKYGSYIAFLDLISQSLRANTGNDYWISSHDFATQVDIKMIQIYLGLIYQQLPEKAKIGGKTFRERLSDFAIVYADNADQVKASIQSILENAEMLQDWMDANGGGTLVGDNLIDYWKRVNGLLESFYSLKDISDLEISYPEDYKMFLEGSHNLVTGLEYFNDKDYSGAILAISSCLEKAKFKYAGSFKTYGTFMVNIAEAKDSEDVTAILNAIAENSGGSSEKRNARFNVALNGYIGLDILAEQDQNRFGRISGYLGITAPVGIAISTSDKKGWSYSLFASIIDVGSIAQYRLQEPDNTIEAEIDLSNIISPGINVIFGIPNSPFVFGAGLQSAPTLRKITDPNNIGTTEFSDYVPHVFLAIDIPVINFFSSH